MPGLASNNWFFYKEAYDMDMFKVVDMIATIQQTYRSGNQLYPVFERYDDNS